MRNTLLVIVGAALLPASIAVAEQSSAPKPHKSAASGRLLSMKGAGTGNSCAAYGSGFVRIDGTETCVKIGGAVSIGVGGSSGGR
jgi:hypothetical protein